MPTATDAAKNILQEQVTISDGIGCTIEHNMNSLIDNITITGTDYVAADLSKPFKKLFPIDSVLKSFRPSGAGIKYAVSGDLSASTYANPKGYTYPIDYRTYYPGAETYYKYHLCPKGQGANITVTYPTGGVLTNKIVIKFEISHSTPATWNIYKENDTLIASGTSSDIVAFGSGVYNAGTVTIYYNGTSWVKTEPTTISAPVTINSLKLTTSAVSDKYIGVVEISPRWISDLSDRLKMYTVDKETSSSINDILPVGKVTANSLRLDMVSYEDAFVVNSYIKGQAFSSSKIYLYRNAEIKPFYKLYYSGAPLTDSKGSYEKISQGTYFLDNWDISEFGDITLNALDGAKILQETIAPNILCSDFSATAIIRRLLDSIGFTNYKINIKMSGTTITDNSVFSPSYWWTDDSIPVWNAIQELCRDSQMVACFDDNNILQFYTRDYLFDSTRSINWTFRHSKSGNLLPNIISLNKKDISAANQIKVLWSTRYSNEVLPGNAQPLWQSGTDFIGAFSLEETLPSTSGPGAFIKMLPVQETLRQSQVFYRNNGYIVLNSEIIEFDAVEYRYTDKTGSKVTVSVSNNGDIQKILGNIMLRQQAYSTIEQTGRVRIKERGMFGTTVATHPADVEATLQSWGIYDTKWEIS